MGKNRLTTWTKLHRRFGDHVRSMRTRRELTQEALAERSDLSVDAIRRIERGGFSPSLDTLGKLSVGLEVSLKTLFHSFDMERSDGVAEICDYLASRSGPEVKLAWRVLQAMFDKP
ncbi:helix-turn-helix transcriptional regulator [Corallococcus sp. bb12-1]|uniref:XRE family transcriptional regulator n=1 Tax=Corallococcus terminator TaxID=2316733 RepID=A0A3A8IH81_9BACT|nr:MULTISPECIES: helix-turn-helix transcriptional regulator [Corallococcus]MCY1046828.1 helix-turn-helix transcriptional regulator [Corallococcus sp. bb12-1]RKG82799.1 XRE family transcriptional regulator [Corallococcus terminator]